MNSILRTLAIFFSLIMFLLISSCAPKYISMKGYSTTGYFNYAEIKERYNILVTSLSTFEGVKYDAIGELTITINPAILNINDFEKLSKQEREKDTQMSRVREMCLYMLKY